MERRTEYTIPAPEYKVLHIRVLAALKQQVKTAARAERRTMTQLVTLAIEKYLDGQTKGDQK